MKKFLVIMLSLVMALTMFTACGQKEETAETEKFISGSLPVMGATEEEMTQSMLDLGFENSEAKYFDDLNALVLALQGEKISVAGRIPEATAQYIANNYSDIKAEYLTDKGDPYLNYSMGFNSDKQKIADKVQVAIDEMKSDGTLDKLSAEYIDAFVEGGEPSSVDMPVIASAETIKVVVTGDLPPFDYVSADGKPCGFNTAMLAELSKRIGMNIELVCTNSAGRAAALASGKADAVFYMSEYVSNDMKYDNDCPEGVIAVGPFYETKCYTLLKAE